MVDGSAHFRGLAAGARGACVAVAAIAAGCGSTTTHVGGAARQLSPGEFRDPAAPTAERAVPLYAPTPARPERVEIRTLSEAEARGEVEAIDVGVGAPTLAPEGVAAGAGEPGGGELTPDDLELVDAKVGDLNGRPIQAREWLEPMGARLAAESAGRARPAWRAYAREAILGEIISQLKDELFLAEARSAMTPEETAGLRVFLQRFEREQVARTYGSQTLADEYARQTYGMSLEEVKRERERAALIVDQLRRKVWDRVQVSSRDLEIEYERNIEKYNPPPQAVFLVIRVRSADAETVAAIDARVRGEPFPEVFADERNLQKEPLTRAIPEGVEKAELFGAAALQEAAITLAPGGSTGPIESGTSTYWIYFDRIEDNSRSLYDVQLELRDQITAERQAEESARYVLRILGRAGISEEDLEALTVELVDVAEAWYYRPEGG